MGFTPIIPDALGPLNVSHGLANGLVSVFQFNTPGKPVDLVNPRRGVTVSGYGFDGTGANGPSFKASTTSDKLVLAPQVPSNYAWTISTLTRFPIDNNSNAVLARDTGASIIHVARNGATDALASFTGGAFRNFSPTIAPLTLSGFKRLTVTGHAGGVIAYLDGVFAGSHAFVTNGQIGSLLPDSSTANRAWGAAKDCFAWNRTLGPGEVMEHAQEPFAMFRADLIPVWLFVSGGGAGNTPLTVTLGQASWASAGQAPLTDFRLGVTLGQASWAANGFAPLTNFRLGIILALAIWSWTGRPMSGLGAVAAHLGLFPVKGSKENLRAGSRRGGTDAT